MIDTVSALKISVPVYLIRAPRSWSLVQHAVAPMRFKRHLTAVRRTCLLCASTLLCTEATLRPHGSWRFWVVKRC